MPDRDPVQEGLGGEDLYDVADWSTRSALDRVAVSLYRFLHASRKWVLILLALVLFVAQLSFAGLLLARRPELGLLALLSAVPAVALVAYVWYGDPTRREPFENLAVTFVLSVIFAAIAALVNTLLGGLFDLVPVVGTALFFFRRRGPHRGDRQVALDPGVRLRYRGVRRRDRRRGVRRGRRPRVRDDREHAVHRAGVHAGRCTRRSLATTSDSRSSIPTIGAPSS